MNVVSTKQVPSGHPSLGGGSELREVLIDKARELFALCDTENKGFITKRCMQRLKGEIPLEADQLEEVFDRLDGDGNGFLTLDEFTDGFGMFMGIDTRPRKMSCSHEEMFEAFQESRGRVRRVSSVEEVDEDQEEKDRQFEEFLDSLGAHQLFKDEDYVKLMWNHLRGEDPNMLANFEEFLQKVTGNIKMTEKECSSLESALMNRKQQQDEQVQKLYEEMENQLKVEKERALNEERRRQDRLRQELASELSNKDSILQDLLSKQSQLEERLTQINGQDTDIKLRNAKLEKERDTLAKRLKETETVVEKMQSYMENLRQQSLEEKRARAQSALQATETMALEREQMIKQLEMLRAVNKQLLDQKDEINSLLRQRQEATLLDAEERRSDYFSIDPDDPVSLVSNASAGSGCGLRDSRAGSFKARRGSRISDYLNGPNNGGQRNMSSLRSSNPDEGTEMDEAFEDNGSPSQTGRDSRSSGRGSLPGSPTLNQPATVHETECKPVTDHPLRDSEGGIDEKVLWAVHETSSPASAPQPAQRTWRRGSLNPFARAQDPPATNATARPTRTLVHPERLFKVVIVGDSAVGKSSLINRFCRGHFAPSFNTTIGVDFQVKSVIVEGRSVALQLWDTAGQEKFRAITQQYFRKADGVIIVYDVTSEESFKNVRAWVSTLQEGITDEVAVMIIGNKADMDTALRMVSFSTGQKLAHEYEAIFHETSAKTGQGIEPAMQHLASLLRVKEDEEIEKAVNLRADVPTGKRCC